MIIRVKKFNQDAEIPAYATEYSAGCDLKSRDTVVIAPHSTVLIHTGIAIEPEHNNCVINIFARSGLATKHGISLANGVGVIDPDYRGEIIVALHNHSAHNHTIFEGDRVAQMVIYPIIVAEFEETDELNETDRGAGGFGSTGRK